MVEKNVGLLVVCDAKHKAKPTDRVDEIGTRRVVTVKSNVDVAEAAKAMNKHRIRHVVVVDDEDKPTGVISMRDLVGERATLTAILQSHEKEVFIGGD